MAIRAFFLILIALLGGAAAAFSEQPISTILEDLRDLPITAFLDESFRELAIRDPEAITAWGLAGYFGVSSDRLTNISISYTKDTMALEEGVLEILRQYDRTLFDDRTRGWLDAYDWFLDDLVRSHPFRFHSYPINGFLDFSVPAAIDVLFSGGHPLHDREDVENYLARLACVPEKIDQLIESMEYRIEQGILTPKLILQSGQEKIDSVLGVAGKSIASGEEIPVVWVPALRSFKQRLDQIPSLSEDEKRTWRELAETRFLDSYIPSLWALRGKISSWRLSSPDEGGAATLPDGKAYFEQCLRHETSTDLLPSEVHEIGLREVERLTDEVRSQYADLGHTSDAPLFELSLQARVDDKILDPQSEEGLETLFAHFRDLLEETQQLIEPYFNLQPVQQVTLVPAPPDAGSNYYLPPAWDGSRSGTFNVATSGRWAESQLMVVFHHEAVPGHHMQQALAVELDLPMFMRYWISNGMAEGWGLYCESLMFELGMYEGRPLENLARLNLELYRAVRMVADTGIHAYGWTRQQAASYMEDVLGFPPGFFFYEIERYVILPGQASGYVLGKLAIEEWRDRAHSALGNEFELASFHDVILGSGGIPLQVLETFVDRFIERTLMD